MPCGPQAKGFCMNFNGYYWTRMSRDSQAIFITAYSEGAEIVLRALRPKAEHQEISDFISLFVPLVDPDEEIAGLNGFYEAPDNLGVPISRALQVLAFKKSGETAAVIQKLTEGFRKEADTYK
jgi:hypothetical protein